jgi:hypothetical protein
VNASGHKISTMMMWPDGAQPDSTNWLGTGSKALTLDEGKQFAFHVKPGSYRFAFLFQNNAGNDDTRYLATNAMSGAPGPVFEITGAANLVIGSSPHADVPAGGTLVVPLVDTYGKASANCKPIGAVSSIPTECCSLVLEPNADRCGEAMN